MVQQIRDEVKQRVEKMPAFVPVSPEIKAMPSAKTEENLFRYAPWPMYRVDNLVRRATALQAVLGDAAASICINQKLADQLQMKTGDQAVAIQGECRVTLPINIDDRLADNVVLLPSGLTQTAGFGSDMAAITLQREKV